MENPLVQLFFEKLVCHNEAKNDLSSTKSPATSCREAIVLARSGYLEHAINYYKGTTGGKLEELRKRWLMAEIVNYKLSRMRVESILGSALHLHQALCSHFGVSIRNDYFELAVFDNVRDYDRNALKKHLQKQIRYEKIFHRKWNCAITGNTSIPTPGVRYVNLLAEQGEFAVAHSLAKQLKINFPDNLNVGLLREKIWLKQGYVMDTIFSLEQQDLQSSDHIVAIKLLFSAYSQAKSVGHLLTLKKQYADIYDGNFSWTGMLLQSFFWENRLDEAEEILFQYMNGNLDVADSFLLIWRYLNHKEGNQSALEFIDTLLATSQYQSILRSKIAIPLLFLRQTTPEHSLLGAKILSDHFLPNEVHLNSVKELVRCALQDSLFKISQRCDVFQLLNHFSGIMRDGYEEKWLSPELFQKRETIEISESGTSPTVDSQLVEAVNKIFYSQFWSGKSVIPKEILTDWAKKISQTSEVANRDRDCDGLLIFSTHINQSYPISIGAAASGEFVITLTATPSTLRNNANLNENDQLINYSRSNDFGPKYLFEMYNALLAGKLVHLTADREMPFGQNCLVVWYDGVRFIPVTPSYLWCNSNCRLIFSDVITQFDGQLNFVTFPIELPSTSLSITNRINLGMQKISGAVRSHIARHAGQLLCERVGGRFRKFLERETIPVTEYVSSQDPGMESSHTALLSKVHPTEDIAFVKGSLETRFGELASLSLRVARFGMSLAQSKVQSRNPTTIDDYFRIAICLPPSAQLSALIMGFLGAGVVVTCFDEKHPPKQLFKFLDNFQPDVFIASPCILDNLRKERELHFEYFVIENRAGIPCLETLLEGISEATELPPYNPEAPGLVAYTSGSTGVPKGIVLTHDNMAKSSGSFDLAHSLSSRDNVLTIASWSHVALVCILAIIRSGATYFCLPSSVSKFPSSVVSFLYDQKITIFSAPVSYISMISRFGGLSIKSAPHIRITELWGEPLLKGFAKEIFEAMSPSDIVFVYDSSEAAYATARKLEKADFAEVREETTPVSEISWAKVSCNREAILGQDFHEGLLCVTGRNVMLGYWDNIRNQHINSLSNSPRTVVFQDLVRLYRDGRIYVQGRIDDIVKINGTRVSLKKVESVLNDFPNVEQAVAVRTTNSLGQPIVKAAVSSKMNVDIFELKRFCASYLPSVAIPVSIEPLGEFPMTISGKLDLVKIKSLICEKRQLL